jgi:hypothetical protein
MWKGMFQIRQLPLHYFHRVIVTSVTLLVCSGSERLDIVMCTPQIRWIVERGVSC